MFLKIFTYELSAVISDDNSRYSKAEYNRFHKEFNHLFLTDFGQGFCLYSLSAVVNCYNDVLGLSLRLWKMTNDVVPH